MNIIYCFFKRHSWRIHSPCFSTECVFNFGVILDDATRLLVEGQKMSKSLGNFYTLRDILAKNYSSMAIRYLLLATHYRQKLNFTFKGLEGAKNSLERLKEFISKIENQISKTKTTIQNPKIIKNLIFKTKKDFENAMDDDLNISQTLAIIFNLVKEINILIDKNSFSLSEAKKVYQLMKNFDQVLGLKLTEKQEENISENILNLVSQREKFRQNKQWQKADEIRKQIEKMGYKIEDAKEGPKIKK
ncbi:MAG: DALR domain-containing protein [Patescibacteria group bacterium]